MTVLCALVGYIYGYKHNQIAFLLQTLCFMGFSLEDEYKQSIIFLSNLRFSYYQFTEDNPFSKYPETYVKRAPGNYNFLSVDDSYFRIFGWPFLVTTVIFFMFGGYIVFNLIITRYYATQTNKRGLIKYFHRRKYFLRALEYLYLTTMYPLIFGSVETFKNWNGLTLVKSNSLE